ncbi:MAG: hypothetical protein K5644_00790 [Lachnospiraceae bacterium]|nr:hypothetical protein [Lachnospiraceae bacterium]
MPVLTIVLIILAIVLLGGLIAFYFLGKRADKKRAEQQAQLDAMAQTVSMLVIDKKRLHLKDAGLPQAVMETKLPWYAKASKVPVAKVKLNGPGGSQIMTMIVENEIFEDLPVKKEIKATVSGLYITNFRGNHGKLQIEQKKKKGLKAWALRKQKELKNNK